MNIQRMYEWVDEQASAAALQWFKQQSQDNFAALYLFHKVGELRVAKYCPAGFELSTPARLRPGLTLEQQSAVIREVARKLPILPNEL